MFACKNSMIIFVVVKIIETVQKTKLWLICDAVTQLNYDVVVASIKNWLMKAIIINRL